MIVRSQPRQISSPSASEFGPVYCPEPVIVLARMMLSVELLAMLMPPRPVFCMSLPMIVLKDEPSEIRIADPNSAFSPIFRNSFCSMRVLSTLE